MLCWRLTRGPLLDRLLITGGAIAASTLVWSIRPQVFTVALLPFVITLLVRQRVWWIPGVVLLWANLHGGVMLGLLAIAMWTAVALLYDRGTVTRLATVFGLSAAATFLHPVGDRLLAGDLRVVEAIAGQSASGMAATGLAARAPVLLGCGGCG